MSFLKKLGQGLLKFGQIVTDFLPLATPLLPAAGVPAGVVSELTLIGKEVATAEAGANALATVGPKLAGPQKAALIAPTVAQIILQSPLVGSKKVKDQALFQKAVTAIGGDVADLLNSLE